MLPVTVVVFTAEGTASFLGNRYIPLWGCPRTILSENGLQFFPTFHTLRISCRACASLLPAPILPTVIESLSM